MPMLAARINRIIPTGWRASAGCHAAPGVMGEGQRDAITHNNAREIPSTTECSLACCERDNRVEIKCA